MPFTVQDMNDLLVLSEQHPGWKARLRQILLTEEWIGIGICQQGIYENRQDGEHRPACFHS